MLDNTNGRPGRYGGSRKDPRELVSNFLATLNRPVLENDQDKKATVRLRSIQEEPKAPKLGPVKLKGGRLSLDGGRASEKLHTDVAKKMIRMSDQSGRRKKKKN